MDCFEIPCAPLVSSTDDEVQIGQVERLGAAFADEIVLVDNGSTDGSAAMVRERFPGVRVLALERNLGFGGGANAGVRAARNDIVILLNNDMRVAPDFLPPLLEAFRDPTVFAVSCQIFFSDPKKTREETGLTQGWWEHGSFRVRHRIDAEIKDLYPCFYAGGGSCANTSMPAPASPRTTLSAPCLVRVKTIARSS